MMTFHGDSLHKKLMLSGKIKKYLFITTCARDFARVVMFSRVNFDPTGILG